MNRSTDKKIVLVGTIPAPVGGISEHVWRLGERLCELDCEIWDLQPDKVPKRATCCSVVEAPKYRISQCLWLIKQLVISRATSIHFHFSQPNSLPILAIILIVFGYKKQFFLTLHHGRLSCPKLVIPLFSWVICVFDRIVSLSTKQTAFYTDQLHINKARIIEGSSYIPLPSGELTGSMGLNKKQSFYGDNSGSFICVTSGYPKKIYRYEWAVSAVRRLNKTSSAQLHLCLYGEPDSDLYQKELLAEADKYGVQVHWNLSSEEFKQLLSQADLYLRPTSVDSYGLAVADAITLGVPAIATDVCERHSGCFLVEKNDYKEFEAAVLSVYQKNTENLRVSSTKEQKWIAALYGSQGA